MVLWATLQRVRRCGNGQHDFFPFTNTEGSERRLTQLPTWAGLLGLLSAGLSSST